MPSRNYTLFFIFSVGFVLLSIAFITVLGQANNKDGTNSDIRAKATVQNALKFTGVVNQVDQANNTIAVANVKFENAAEDSKNMGTFIVTVPGNTPFAELRIGRSVLIAVDAQSFNAGSKTMTALSVTPQ